MKPHILKVLSKICAPGVEPMHHKDTARQVNAGYAAWVARRTAQGTLTTIAKPKGKRK